MAKTKTKYTIRLYRQHDLDLITLIATHELDVIRAMYCALTAFSNGEFFIVELTPKPDATIPQLKRVYSKKLKLDKNKDAKAIELLAKIKDGYRNNFLKNLLRLYLSYPISVEFLANREDEPLFQEKFKVFSEARKYVKAGNTGNGLSLEPKEPKPPKAPKPPKEKTRLQRTLATEGPKLVALHDHSEREKKVELNSAIDVQDGDDMSDDELLSLFSNL